MMEFINTVPGYLTTISPKVRHLILKAAWFMDKKYYTAQMRELLDALKARPKEDFTGKKFLVTGIMLDAEPVLELLEELGVAVVDDLLCHESMQFRTPTRAGGTVESKLAYRFLDLKGPLLSMSRESPWRPARAAGQGARSRWRVILPDEVLRPGSF